MEDPGAQGLCDLVYMVQQLRGSPLGLVLQAG